jgi:hypothetical protein
MDMGLQDLIDGFGIGMAEVGDHQIWLSLV